MAKNVTLGLSILLLIMVLTMAPIVRSHSSNLITKEITLYGDMILQGPNTNVIPVAGAPGQPRNFTTFGTVFVIDISLRKNVNHESPRIGDVQGILVISSLDRRQVYVSASVNFESGEYQGSTLEFQGAVGTANAMLGGELAAVGGTNSLRFAEGYASLRTIIPVAGTDNTINELKIFLKHDQK